MLGLINFSSTESLVPNYSVSIPGTLIGTFAYALFNLCFIDLLRQSRGLAARPPYPSWMPDWQALNCWAETTVNPMEEVETIGKAVRMGSSNGPDPQACPVVTVSDIEHLWHRDSSVCSSDASLSIELLHLMRTTSKPVLKFKGTAGIHGLEICTDSCLLSIVAEAIPLGFLDASSIHMFLLKRKPGESDWLLLFMQEADQVNTYKMVTCCCCYEVSVYSHHIRIPAFMENEEKIIRPWTTLHAAIKDLQDEWRSYFVGRASASDISDRAKLSAGIRYVYPFQFGLMFPGKHTNRSIFSGLQGILEDERQNTNFLHFKQAYARILESECAEYSPRIDDTHVSLCIPAKLLIEAADLNHPWDSSPELEFGWYLKKLRLATGTREDFSPHSLS